MNTEAMRPGGLPCGANIQPKIICKSTRPDQPKNNCPKPKIIIGTDEITIIQESCRSWDGVLIKVLKAANVAKKGNKLPNPNQASWGLQAKKEMIANQRPRQAKAILWKLLIMLRHFCTKVLITAKIRVNIPKVGNKGKINNPSLVSFHSLCK